MGKFSFLLLDELAFEMELGMSKTKIQKTLKAKKSSRKKSGAMDFLENVSKFRGIKKALVGKSRAESLDLLDEWMLKKRTLSRFF